MAVRVPISAIQFDPETQPRVQIDLLVVQEYADAMVEGAEFPPVTLFRDGDVYWIGDGFHRCIAARDLGLAEIAADVTPGVKRDAIFASLGVNAEHGVRRKNADKQRAVRIMLEDEEWGQWGNREIARQCGVSEFMVRTHRDSICDNIADGKQRKFERDGKVHMMNTAPIGGGLSDEARERLAEADAHWDEIRQNQKDLERLAKLPAEQQLPVLNLMATEDKSAGEAMKQVRAEVADAGDSPPLPDGVYSVILADPPWKYEFSETDTRAIERQYRTMTLDELKELPVDSISADDSVLFLWATSPKLVEALEVMEAWGFKYTTCMVWVKDKIGMGYWARQQHELLLIGKHGHLSPPAEADRVSSVINAPRTEHSRKPEEVHGIIEAMLPNASRVELFCRDPKEGWDAWGNEVG